MIQQIETFCQKVASLGKGYNECIYQEALCSELRNHSIQYSKEQVIPILYDNLVVVGNMRMDIVLPYYQIVIEMKAIDGELKESHIPQIITYLKGTGYSCGIFVNFIQNPNKALYEIYTVEKKVHEEDSSLYYLCKNRLLSDKTFCFNEQGIVLKPQKGCLFLNTFHETEAAESPFLGDM